MGEPRRFSRLQLAAGCPLAPSRTQAVVVARRRAGEMFGERTLLLGGEASASIVVDSEKAVLIRLTDAYLNKLFKSNPGLPGKFFCFLATDQVSS